MTQVPPREPTHLADDDKPLPNKNQLKLELTDGPYPGEKILTLAIFSPQGTKLTEHTYTVNAAITNKDDEVY
jgi:hypothetical protein